MSYSRRDFLRLTFSGSSIAFTSLLASNLFFCLKDKRPNFIIFLADDLGYGDLGCYGSTILQTPNIDAFAQEGMRFTDCHSGGTVCSPSRASLLTGRNPYRSGFYYIMGGGAFLRREEITMAKLLKNRGYDTCFVGKWHLSRFTSKDQPTPKDHGFEHWFATEVNAFEGPQNPQKFYRNGEKVGPVFDWYCNVIVKEALNWLKNRQNPDKPFFLFVSTHEPHTPLAPPENFAQAYENSRIDSLEQKIHYGGVDRPQKNIGHLKKYYYGTVTQLDQAFGNFIKAVDDLGYRENSLVFFTSDNGPEAPVNIEESRGEWEDLSRDRCFGTPGPYRGMKRYPYEGGHRVPGIVRWPGHTKPNSTSFELINGTDILPTFCNIAGIKVPDDRTIDGVNIINAFAGKQINRDKAVAWFFPAHEDTYYRMPHMAIREEEYSLLAWFNPKKEDQLIMDWIKKARLEKFSLYNLAGDVGQLEDISNNEPERFESMKLQMINLWKDIQAEGP